MPSTKTNSAPSLTNADLRNAIFIKGARANNLKNIDLDLPKNQLVVVTGVSGSGKSSLTMDTLFAEGQRRYVESLSAYARQFLMRMKKPDVDYIRGICPAIAIEQKTTTANARSTVGTLTEVYDFLRLLYARIGKTYSPISGELVRRHSVTDVVDFVLALEAGSRIQLFAPLGRRYADRLLEKELDLLLQKGYTRISIDGKLEYIEEVLDSMEPLLKEDLGVVGKRVLLLIDRLAVKPADAENTKRLADSIQTAFQESEGDCFVEVVGAETYPFSNRFELDGQVFLEPTPQLFNFNNPFGACPKCEGFGRVMGIDAEKVIPDPTLSVYDGAIAAWRGEKYGQWLESFLDVAHQFDFPVHRPYQDLNEAEQQLLWTGNRYFAGIDDFFAELEQKTYKIQNRVMLARYRGRTICPVCRGGRLRKEATYVKVAGRSINQLIDLPIDELLAFMQTIELNDFDAQVGKRLLLEIRNRLQAMSDLGLTYLTLNRLSSTLSGGESQRINLTRTLGSNLTASMYILDEPSVGLHPRDTNRLVNVLQRLRDLGNTVVVVEHEEDVIASADYLIDIGPGAGIHGGQVVFAGPYKSIYEEANESLTARYMSGRTTIPVPKKRRKVKQFLEINGGRLHNLQRVDVRVPLGALSVVSGVSGSGKTSLVKGILYPALRRELGDHSGPAPGAFKGLGGSVETITQVELVSQSPIGRSSRSNPVTYVKAYDAIRSLMASQQLSKIRGFKPSHFSFNVDGGRCDTCKGEGEQVVEMQFLADVRLVCETCNGRRFKQEILDVRYKEKNIFEILELSVEEALDFFAEEKEIVRKMQPLFDVGLGYIKLGQSSSTLSGGEAQRVKLAGFLQKERSTEHIFFIFDEPTTGLHFEDVRILLKALNALVERGHTVCVVEHNMDVIKSADWLIDLGPEGGKHGGQLVYQGVPEGLLQEEASHTGYYLKEKLA